MRVDCASLSFCCSPFFKSFAVNPTVLSFCTLLSLPNRWRGAGIFLLKAYGSILDAPPTNISLSLLSFPVSLLFFSLAPSLLVFLPGPVCYSVSGTVAVQTCPVWWEAVGSVWKRNAPLSHTKSKQISSLWKFYFSHCQNVAIWVMTFLLHPTTHSTTLSLSYTQINTALTDYCLLLR